MLDTAATTAGMRVRAPRSWSTTMTVNSAVSAKSMPVVSNGMSEPTSPPSMDSATQ